MTAYLDGQLVIADDLLVTGSVKLLGGGNIETVANNDLTLLPNGTGITIIGDAGSPGRLGTPTNDDFFVSGRMEVDGTAYFDGAINLNNTCINAVAIRSNDNVQTRWGVGNDSAMEHSTDQTPDSLILGVGAESNAWIICEKADIGTDFAVAQRTDPAQVIQSGDATTPAQRILAYHDRADGVAETETGDYLIKTPAQKTLRLGTVVWGDHRVSLTRVQGGGLKPPAWTQFQDNGAGSVGVYAWAFGDEAAAGNEEQMWFGAELPHGYKQGTDIVAHLHWSPAVGGAAGEFVKWGLEYTWKNIDGTYGNTTITTSDASAAATATTSGDGTMIASKHYVTIIGTISGSGMEVSSMLMCRVFRNSSHANDDLAQDAFGLDMDFHFEVDTLGSRQAFVK